MASFPERPELDLRAALRIIRSRLPLVLLPVVLLTGLQLGSALRATPIYSASTELLLQTKATDALVSGVGNVNNAGDTFDPARVINTEIRVVESPAVLDAATKVLGYDAEVSATGDDTSDILTLTATDPDPQRAARTANAVAKEYVKFRRQQSIKDLVDASAEMQTKVDGYQAQIDAVNVKLADPINGAEPMASTLKAQRDGLVRQQQTYQARIDGLGVDAALKTGGASVLTAAVESSAPISPRPLRSAILGMFLGLVLGLGLAFLLEFLDDRIKSKDDLTAVGGGKPVLGLIPRMGHNTGVRRRRRTIQLPWRQRPVPVARELPPESAEAYRALRTAIQFMALDKPIRVIQVTSSKSGEGKSTTVANLARVMCQAGHTVMVIDGDLRHPRINEFFGIANEVGLSNVLSGTVGIAKGSRSIDGVDDLAVMPSGPIPPNPAELLGSQRARDVITAVLQHFDVVIIDGPPVLPVADPLVIAQHVDATLVVARSGRSTRDDVVRTLETLQQANAPVIGFVLNSVERTKRYGRYGYGRYGYGYGYGSADSSRRRTPPPPTTKTSEVWVPDDSDLWNEDATPGALPLRATPVGSALDRISRDETAKHDLKRAAALRGVAVPDDARLLTTPLGDAPL